ncbi:hypothetical protein PF672P1_00062 [Parabacteroides phage PF672P1]|nr:hypothetical protein PF672P1_00062 [Parabacteroides phage PF672P1]
MNRHNDNYNLHTDVATTSEELNIILEDANARYNAKMWQPFTDVLPATYSKKFSTIVKETGIVVEASLLSPMGVKPLRSATGQSGYSDSIHKIGHGFKVDQADLNYFEELNLVNNNMSDMILETYSERALNVVGGFHKTWNRWVFEAISNQSVNLGSLGGSTFNVDLRTPAANKMKVKGDKPWFDPAATTVNKPMDLVRMNKYATDVLNMPQDRVFLVSKELMDKIALDEEFLTVIRNYVSANTLSDFYLNPERVIALLPTVLGIPPIVAIDEKSAYEDDGIPVIGEAAFNKGKISLVPARKLFNMHNSPSDYMKDPNPSTIKTAIEGGLIGALQKFGSEPIEVVTNMESWSFISFKNPKWIVSLDTTAYSATGE